jgi:hypothetical protein
MSRFVQIIPIIRGLLANPTGDEDIPYEPVILKSLTSKEAIDFAGSAENAEAKEYPAPLSKSQKPPLFVNPADFDADPENLRKQLSDAISDYSARHNSKPEIVCLRGLGILYLDTGYSILDTRKRRKSRIENQEPSIKHDLPLKNKVALVTGAAGAIGYGICRGLLENGCHLVATDLPGRKLDDFVADLKQIRPGRMKPSFKPGAELILWLSMQASRWSHI